MKDLKNLIPDEETARELLEIADRRPKNGCVCDAICCDTACRIKNLKQSGIISKSALEEARGKTDEQIDNIKTAFCKGKSCSCQDYMDMTWKETTKQLIQSERQAADKLINDEK
jgi:hypothetical protein